MRVKGSIEAKLVIYIGQEDYRDLMMGVDRAIAYEITGNDTMAGYPFYVVRDARYLAVHEV